MKSNTVGVCIDVSMEEREYCETGKTLARADRGKKRIQNRHQCSGTHEIEGYLHCNVSKQLDGNFNRGRSANGNNYGIGYGHFNCEWRTIDRSGSSNAESR